MVRWGVGGIGRWNGTTISVDISFHKGRSQKMRAWPIRTSMKWRSSIVVLSIKVKVRPLIGAHPSLIGVHLKRQLMMRWKHSLASQWVWPGTR